MVIFFPDINSKYVIFKMERKYMSCALVKLNRYCLLTQMKKNVEKKPTKKQLFYQTRISILSILYRSAVNKVVYGQYVKVYCQK